MDLSALLRLLKRALRLEDPALPAGQPSPPEEAYEPVFRRVGRRMLRVEKQIRQAEELVARRFREFEKLPEGRRQTMLRSCSAVTLVVLARDLMRRSYAERFGDLARSLRLASIAVEVSEAVGRSDYLSPEALADLEAEALLHLGNALRINSDIPRAEKALGEAGERLRRGTGARDLKADYWRHLAILRGNQGRSDEAAGYLDREIALRRLLGDPHALGISLMDRGWIACRASSPDEACGYIRAGAELVEDQRALLLGLDNLAETLARDGQGLEAWKVLAAADLLHARVREERIAIRHRWIRGLAYRALGEAESAASTLRAVREQLSERGEILHAAYASLDLASILAAQGHHAELKELLEEAYEVFRAERIERRALAAFVVLHRAVQAEQASEQLALEVANFMVRAPFNRNLRFDGAAGTAG